MIGRRLGESYAFEPTRDERKHVYVHQPLTPVAMLAVFTGSLDCVPVLWSVLQVLLAAAAASLLRWCDECSFSAVDGLHKLLSYVNVG